MSSPRGRTRRALRRVAALAAVLGLATTGLAACATATTDTAARTVRIGVAGGSTGTVLDPHLYTDALGTWFGWAFYESIGVIDPDGQYRNVLADSFTHNEDATSWTLVLKDGITFHSGKPLTADDVIFTFDRLLDPATAATAAGVVSVIDTMTKVDDRTVRFDLRQPRGTFDALLSDGGTTGIIPTDFDVTRPDSTGPWVFDGYTPGVEIRLKRFDGYHGTPPKLDGISFLSLPDDNARMNALLSGQIDADPFVRPSQLPQIQSDPRFTVLDLPTGAFSVITMRVDQGPTADPRVREALRLAVDREQIVTVVDGGRARVGNDVYGIEDPAYRTDLVRTRDVDRAKALVAEAGAEGAHLTLYTILAIEPVAQIVAQNAREIGLDVEVEVRDDATYFSHGYLEYDFAVDQWATNSMLMVATLTDAPGASLPYTRFRDPEFDAYYEIAATTTDASARKAALGRMQEILFDRGGFIIPRFTDLLVASAAGVSGWPPSDPLGGFGLMKALPNLSWTP